MQTLSKKKIVKVRGYWRAWPEWSTWGFHHLCVRTHYRSTPALQSRIDKRNNVKIYKRVLELARKDGAYINKRLRIVRAAKAR